jgi:hypothetical protein
MTADRNVRRKLCVGLVAGLAGVAAGKSPSPEKTMNPLPAGEPSYFARAHLYSVPIRPELPISEALAERARSFYRLMLDGERVRWAEKWLVERTALPNGAALPGGLGVGVHFYVPSPDGGPARAVSLAGIRDLAVCLRVEVVAQGQPPLAEKVTRERTLRHDYGYWDNGRLRRWRCEAGADRGDERFDEAGKLLR